MLLMDVCFKMVRSCIVVLYSVFMLIFCLCECAFTFFFSFFLFFEVKYNRNFIKDKDKIVYKYN